MSNSPPVAHCSPLNRYETLGRQPIDSELPAGVSARDTPDYELLVTEVSREESLTSPLVDWQKVVELCTDILDKQSKDLLVGVYLARGLFQLHGYPGLRVGLGVLSDMLTLYWESLEPPLKRMRGRSSALRWFADHLLRQVKNNPPSIPQQAELSALRQTLKRFIQKCAARFGESPREFDEIVSTLESCKPSLADAASTTDASLANDSAPPQAPTRKASTRKRQQIRQLRDELVELANSWRQSHTSRSVRLRFLALWLDVHNTPVANSEGGTALVAPNATRVVQIEEMVERDERAKSYEAIEAMLQRHIFWLDGVHLYAQLLARGEDTTPHKLLLRETAVLIESFPELPLLRYSDGSPFANVATRHWLQTDVVCRDDEVRPPDTQSTLQLAQSTHRDNAERLMQTGQLSAAIALLDSAIRSATSAREAFLVGLDKVGLLIHAGRADLAVAALEPLERECAGHDLEHWEPELARPFAKCAYDALAQLQMQRPATQTAAQLELAFSRVARLDPDLALRLRPQIESR